MTVELISKSTLRGVQTTFATILFGVSLFCGQPATAQDDRAVARVNGDEITEADLALAEEAFAPQLGEMPEDAKRSILVDALIDMRLAADAAKADGVLERPEVKRRLAFLEQQTLRSIYADEALADAVPDDAVRALYDEQMASIPAQEETRLRHVLVGTAAEARAVIDGIAAGEPFEDVARNKSLDEISKSEGGDLGYLTEDEMLPEIASAVAGLEKSEHTGEPVETAFGFHVVKVEDIRDQPGPAFEDLAPRIRQALEGRAQRELIAGLRESAEIEKLVPDVAPPPPDDGHQH